MSVVIEENITVAKPEETLITLVEEIAQTIDDVKMLLRDQQNTVNNTNSKIRSLEKLMAKRTKEEAKKRRNKRARKPLMEGEEAKPRKPCGFKIPTSISDELCEFIGCAKGVCVPRTEITKFMSKYISEKQLQNPENRRFIIPDTKLAALLGADAVGQELTHFTMQRYLKRHFPPSKKDISAAAAATVSA